MSPWFKPGCIIEVFMLKYYFFHHYCAFVKDEGALVLQVKCFMCFQLKIKKPGSVKIRPEL